MVNKVFSCSFTGLECNIIEVQADISNGLPSFSIVGLGDASVQESRERVRSSIKNSGARFPQIKKTINLAPAQLRKQGSLFDLPIAISILLADRQIKPDKIKNSIIVGELSLTGKVKKIKGALAITQHAKQQGFKRIFLPDKNALEASFIDDIEIYPLKNLKEYIDYCNGKIFLKPLPHSKIQFSENYNLSLANIIGLKKAKRALAIAAAGGHNTLLSGSPGCGKTVLCRAFRSILPNMTNTEILETTKTYSVSGLLDPDSPLITKRPFREVHHTCSLPSIIGGGNKPKPGEISLAHNGVLFLDEIAEFPRKILESLRQPLEDKYIHINRSNYSLKFPCNFLLLATMNPCPCGYKNDRKIWCICSDNQIKNYQKRLSGPLIDRFDLFIEISRVPMEKIFVNKETEYLENQISSIKNAWQIQKNRFINHISIHKNADMDLKEIRKYCNIDKNTKNLLNKASKSLNLSNRGYVKTLKIARTIADLENKEEIKKSHIAEAVQYRFQR